MKTIDDILDLFYSIVNVATVTDLIDGAVYRLEKNINSESQDIVLRPNSIGGADRLDIQAGTMQINCFAKNHERTSRPDEAKLNAVTSSVVTELESFSDLSTYFTFDVISQNILPDKNENLSYSNIRVNYWIEK